MHTVQHFAQSFLCCRDLAPAVLPLPFKPFTLLARGGFAGCRCFACCAKVLPFSVLGGYTYVTVHADAHAHAHAYAYAYA
eukprot:605104-Karenia_brevis.AAC.1